MRRWAIVLPFFDNNEIYGYRRIKACLERAGQVISEKVIRRLYEGSWPQGEVQKDKEVQLMQWRDWSGFREPCAEKFLS